MLGPIINLGCGLGPGVFLFVVNPVFGTGLNPRLLQSENGLVGSFTRQEGISTKPFPVSPGCREVGFSAPCVVSHL